MAVYDTSKWISQKAIIRKYNISKEEIAHNLPKPILLFEPNNRKAPPSKVWDVSLVEQRLKKYRNRENPTSRSSLHRQAIKKIESRERSRLMMSAMASYRVEDMLKVGRTLGRRFVVHVGPTNSGKTWSAIQRLKQAETGVYLGPLRLLALEVFDELNMQGVPCSLLTGEEHMDVPFSGIISSTIEMAKYNVHYNVAVIDEAQMMADNERGGRWTKAIMTLDADEIHVCIAPEGLSLLIDILSEMHAGFEIQHHERLTPLEFCGNFNNLEDVQKGDALIAFSRASVLALAAELETLGIHASVIYGALPPEARREEVRKFVNGETSVVVATDAIGMGVSLPIKRIIFWENTKYDGKVTRPLNDREIKQIAGRAGRFGIYDKGEVYAHGNAFNMQAQFNMISFPIKRAVFPFPDEVITDDMDIQEALVKWQKMPIAEGFKREDVSERLKRLTFLKHIPTDWRATELNRFISCPVDCGKPQLLQYWKSCCLAAHKGSELPEIIACQFNTDSLQECEMAYKACDIRNQMLHRIGDYGDEMREIKSDLIAKINHMLLQSKAEYKCVCRRCGKSIPMRVNRNIEPICTDCLFEIFICGGKKEPAV